MYQYKCVYTYLNIYIYMVYVMPPYSMRAPEPSTPRPSMRHTTYVCTYVYEYIYYICVDLYMCINMYLHF